MSAINGVLETLHRCGVKRTWISRTTALATSYSRLRISRGDRRNSVFTDDSGPSPEAVGLWRADDPRSLLGCFPALFLKFTAPRLRKKTAAFPHHPLLLGLPQLELHGLGLVFSPTILATSARRRIFSLCYRCARLAIGWRKGVPAVSDRNAVEHGRCHRYWLHLPGPQRAGSENRRAGSAPWNR